MDSSGRNKDGTRLSPISIIPQDHVRDEKSFEFWNGDRYEGEYLATKNPLSIVREGEGTYSANDESIYKGRWEKDFLEEGNITFPDKSQLNGTLENMILEGPGIYRFKEDVEIRGFLMNNQFVGRLELKDPTGHIWKSFNSQTENEVFFSPVHPFWQSMNSINTSVMPYNEGEGEF